MITITIDVECKDRFGTNRHFCTVVESVKEIHGALMDCLSEIRKVGWGYLEHTIIVHGERGDYKYDSDRSKDNSEQTKRV